MLVVDVVLDPLTDRPHAAPIRADSAAMRRKPDVFGPRADNAFETVLDGIQEAGNRQAALSSAIAENGRRRHEPELRDVVVEPLGVGVVVGIGRGDPGEHLLVALSRQEIAVGEGGLAEDRQAGIPRGVCNNTCTASNLNDIKHLRPPFSSCPQLWKKHSVEDIYILGGLSLSPLFLDDTSPKCRVIAKFLPRM